MDQPSDEGRWLTATQAARQLGVKRATLYSYVSRGLLPRYRGGSDRESKFAREDVDRMAGGGRHGSAQSSRRLDIRTAISTVTDGRLYYRGHAATALVLEHRFEDIAHVLWTGQASWDGSPWLAVERTSSPFAATESALGTRPTPLERLRIIVPLAAIFDRGSYDLSDQGVAETAGRIIATLVQALPPVSEASSAPAGPDVSIAAHLWPRLSPYEPTPERVRFLDLTLGLLADHELAPTTLAARIAAMAGAGPYAVVSAGLGVGCGSVHGGSLLVIEDALRRKDSTGSQLGALRSHGRQYRGVPGFGHPLYPNGDPRATLLLSGLQDLALDDARQAHVTRSIEDLMGRGLPAPNADFALAAISYVADMVEGASEAMFGIARCAGWIAHALEAYADQGSLHRYRAVYTGRIPAHE